ncbi:hypothetical protein V8B55DRAFT_1343225 [Mucor lusitanicus]|uniref:F-box domain-containing protein n=2 Tax=Mucor circinelloides f. lusitanicus TaxID=29924 RepID=A0A168N352_MUCCL|nr:hypothetical protein FB192DRAFT_1344315 [Mucor lusitanicus]OAD05716.1 hypothetical protein MUCCIDRAFT_106272 [Mucor lusitanicus CBS 277.49]
MIQLPNELLVKIFQHLPLYSQHQCLQVCRTWNAIAQTFIDDETQEVDLYGYAGIRNLVKQVWVNPDRGLLIRQMNFIMQTHTGSPITEAEFLILMKGCSNLAKLNFVNVNPWYYVQYMLSNKVQLPKLEAILFGSRSPKYITEGYKAQLVYQYRSSLHQLCIDIAPTDLSNLGMNSITQYLRPFVNLKYLSLKTSCSIVFDNIIRACPQLQIFKIRISGTASFRVLEGKITGSQDDTALSVARMSQLETLDVPQKLMNLQLYKYLRCCCKYLSKLELYVDPVDDLVPLFGLFGIFDQADTLPITNVSINGNLSEAARLAKDFRKCFPRLNQEL